MRITGRTRVADIVAKHPRAASLFERCRIDYYCRGHRTLAAACADDRADLSVVLTELGRAREEASHDRDWTESELAELTAHIVSAHHVPLRAELSLIEREAAAAAGGADRGGEAVVDLVTALRGEIEPHLDKEERLLFPAIESCERACRRGTSRPPLVFGSLAGAVAVLEREHGSLVTLMARLRQEAADGAPSAPAAGRALVAKLAALEGDLHRHLHLENNILFPRALGLEGSFE